MCELTPEERQEKLDYLTKIVERDGIDSVRQAILDSEVSSYADSSRSDMLEIIEIVFKDGCKGVMQMTVEELAGEMDIQELQDMFEEMSE